VSIATQYNFAVFASTKDRCFGTRRPVSSTIADIVTKDDGGGG
jgi:sterol desaturase/sphingolipid hydroxylase (fatty acid hydroxylase superfamily)